MDTLEIIANIVTVIVSILNLGFVVWVFLKEQKRADDDNEKQDKRQWYKDLGLRRSVSNFLKEIDHFKALSIQYNNGNIKKEEYLKSTKEIENKFLNFKADLLPKIECIDQKSYKKLDVVFLEFQEELYDAMNTVTGGCETGHNKSDQEVAKLCSILYKKILCACVDAGI